MGKNALMADPAESVGDRLRELREKAGLTQQQLADASGVGLSTITQLEQGVAANPRWYTMRALAKALGVSLDELAGGSS